MYQINLRSSISFDASRVWNRIIGRKHSASTKQLANQRFRSRFRGICRKLRDDPERWEWEPFNLPQLTGWDID